MSVNLQMFPSGSGKPTVMVVSHERSGTHFLINSLARGFGYLGGDQRLDMDCPQVPANFYATQDLQNFFAQLAGHHIANPIKSHHAASFMAPVISDVLKGTTILYIYRHPRDVMHSLWRMLKNLEWREGPDCATPAEMMRAQPEGHMMRYQMVQFESMLHRWQSHVSGWADLADAHEGVHMVRYEDLRDDYAATLQRLGHEAIGQAPSDVTPPDRNTAVVVPQSQDSSHVAWSDEDLRHIDDVTGALQARLGYS